LTLLFFLLALHAYREYWRLRTLPQMYHGEFDGECTVDDSGLTI